MRIMNVEDAEKVLRSERYAYWGHINNSKSKRRVQNRINQYVLRWRKFFYLETADDYHILAREIKDMREGRTKKREGRPRRPGDRSKRRTSQRLAEKRRKPDDTETPEAESLFGSAIDFGSDQVDEIPPSEEDINLSSDTSSDEFAQCLSSEIGRTPESISSSFFHLYNPQTLSQDSNIPSLADEAWYHSDGMNDPASISAMLQSGTNRAGDRWVGSLQEDICGNLKDSERKDDLANLNGPHILPGNGDKWSRINVFESNQSVVEPSGLTLAPREDLDLHDPIKSANRTLGCTQTQTQSSGLPLQPDKADDGIQQLREFDQAQLHTIMTELNPQLRGKRGQCIPNTPVPARRPLLAERNDLAPLIEQCLNTLKGFAPHVSGSQKDRTGLEDGRMLRRDGKDMELRMTVECLWNAVRVEPYRIPSHVR